MQNISTRVKNIRHSLKLSQSEFASRMRYGRQYISLLERGKYVTPSPRFLEQLDMLERELNIGKECDENLSHPKPSMRTAPSNMPFYIPPNRLREEPDESEPDFSQCIRWLTHIHDHDAEAFRSVATMLKLLYQKSASNS